jgi:hypothetical protein
MHYEATHMQSHRVRNATKRTQLLSSKSIQYYCFMRGHPTYAKSHCANCNNILPPIYEWVEYLVIQHHGHIRYAKSYGANCNKKVLCLIVAASNSNSHARSSQICKVTEYEVQQKTWKLISESLNRKVANIVPWPICRVILGVRNPQTPIKILDLRTTGVVNTIASFMQGHFLICKAIDCERQERIPNLFHFSGIEVMFSYEFPVTRYLTIENQEWLLLLKHYIWEKKRNKSKRSFLPLSEKHIVVQSFALIQSRNATKRLEPVCSRAQHGKL